MYFGVPPFVETSKWSLATTRTIIASWGFLSDTAFMILPRGRMSNYMAIKAMSRDYVIYVISNSAKVLLLLLLATGFTRGRCVCDL